MSIWGVEICDWGKGEGEGEGAGLTMPAEQDVP